MFCADDNLNGSVCSFLFKQLNGSLFVVFSEHEVFFNQRLAKERKNNTLYIDFTRTQLRKLEKISKKNKALVDVILSNGLINTRFAPLPCTAMSS